MIIFAVSIVDIRKNCFKAPKGQLEKYFVIETFVFVHFNFGRLQSQTFSRTTSSILVICVVFNVGIKRKLFQSSKGFVGQIFLPLKSVLLILYINLTLSDYIVRRWVVHSRHFIYLFCLYYEY